MPASARSSESILAAHFESDGQRRSEQFRRSDLKDESQPLISNLTTLCHPSEKPSGSPFRKLARRTPPSGALSEDDTCPQTRVINPSGTKPVPNASFRSLCRTPPLRNVTPVPSAEPETIFPDVVRVRHASPEAPAALRLRRVIVSRMPPDAPRVLTRRPPG